jgi:hypothetical protein
MSKPSSAQKASDEEIKVYSIYLYWIAVLIELIRISLRLILVETSVWRMCKHQWMYL